MKKIVKAIMLLSCVSQAYSQEASSASSDPSFARKLLFGVLGGELGARIERDIEKVENEIVKEVRSTFQPRFTPQAQAKDSTEQTYQIGNTSLTIYKGTILNAHTQAIVNAANKELQGGAGVCGAIFKAAGSNELQKACNNVNPIITTYGNTRCPVGEARITPSFGLKDKGLDWIIHAVGPDCRISAQNLDKDMLLSNAYTNSLTLADENNITSIAFPFISSAIYAFPKKLAAQIAIAKVKNYINTHPYTRINTIKFALFNDEDFNQFKPICDAHFLTN